MNYVKKPVVGWTTEERVILREMLFEGNSASIISEHPLLHSNGRTRSGVIAKIHRLGLNGTTALQPVIRKKPGRVARYSPKPKPKPVVAPPQPILEGTWLTLMELKAHQCHWPMNNPPKGGKFLFCGSLKKAESSYCHHHYECSIAQRETS